MRCGCTTRIIWASGGGANIEAQIIGFARIQLDLPVPDVLSGKPLNLEQQIAWCWSHWPLGSSLIVLDDIDSIMPIKSLARGLRGHVRLLATTRVRQLELSFPQIALDVLSPIESLELMGAIVGSERVAGDQAATEQLCSWLGHLPLALELVGRYLAAEQELSFRGMLERLETHELEHEALQLSSSHDPTYSSMMTAQREACKLHSS
jgi:hypothetical protein